MSARGGVSGGDVEGDDEAIVASGVDDGDRPVIDEEGVENTMAECSDAPLG